MAFGFSGKSGALNRNYSNIPVVFILHLIAGLAQHIGQMFVVGLAHRGVKDLFYIVGQVAVFSEVYELGGKYQVARFNFRLSEPTAVAAST